MLGTKIPKEDYKKMKIGFVLPNQWEQPSIQHMRDLGAECLVFENDYEHLQISKDLDIDAMEDELAKWCADNKVNFLVAGHSFSSFIKASVSQRLGLPTLDFTTISICSSKYLARRFADDPSFFFPLDPELSIEYNLKQVPKYPFYLKPCYGAAGFWHKVVKNEEQLIEYLK